MLPTLRTDIVSLFDLQLETHPARATVAAAPPAMPDRLAARYAASFDWIFYRDDHNETNLPSTRRLSLSGLARDPRLIGASILVSEAFGAAVLSLWYRFEASADPLDAKRSSWEEQPGVGECMDRAKALGFREMDGERQYPFVAVRVPANGTELDAFVNDHAEEVGRLYTGGYDRERTQHLRALVETDVSWRRYEKLWVRWTDALAVYTDDIDEDLYEDSLFRAVQAWEACILIRRMLRRLALEADGVATRRLDPTRAFRAGGLVRLMSEIERIYTVSPPVSSEEGRHLLEACFERFGI